MHRNTNELFVDNYFLMKFRNSNSYTPAEYKQEQEANAFAAALLMPEEFLQKEVASKDISAFSETELITELAKRFEVSVAAMTYRLTNLNIYFKF